MTSASRSRSPDWGRDAPVSLSRQLDLATTEVTTVPSVRMLGASPTVCLAWRDWSNVRLRESALKGSAVAKFISRGFTGRRRVSEDLEGRLPPGQYAEAGFPVLTAG